MKPRSLLFPGRLLGLALLLPVHPDSVAMAAAAAAADAPVTFHEHVAPVLRRHCVVCHHDTEDAPFPLVTFADARKHGRECVDVTRRGFMPPWLPAPGILGGFEGERHLPPEEARLFQRWVEAGMPEGDASRGGPPAEPPSDWQLGVPDLVVRMPAAYTVPAEGRDVYRHFVLPVTMDRKRWVRAWQFRPRSRAVHHIFLMLDRTSEGRRRDAADAEPGFPGMDTPVGIELPTGHFSSWQPGAGARRLPAGMAWALEPGMDLVVQMHLQPLGRPEPFQAEVGFYFTDQPPTREPVKLALLNYDIDLPPGSSNVVVGDELVLPAAVDLLGFLPHTHYLGRRIEAKASLPDGTSRDLFLIPDWDFNWQGDYALKQPHRLPAGTRVSVAFTFDNSEANPRNPFHPPQRVRYGVNTTDEMAELWLQLLPVDPADSPRFRQLAFERGIRDLESSNRQRLRIDPRDARAMVNLGRASLARRQPSEARSHFTAAAATDPSSDEAHYYLGVLHRLANQPEEARREFEQAVALNPRNARALGNLGILHLSANRAEPAARYLGEAIRQNPHDAVATSALGALRLSQNQVPEALELLTRAQRLDPEDQDTVRLIGIARQRLEQPPEFLRAPGR